MSNILTSRNDKFQTTLEKSCFFSFDVAVSFFFFLIPMDDIFWIVFQLVASFVLLVVASWCVGEGGEILGKKYDASIIGGLVIAWLNTSKFYFSELNKC